MSALVLNGLSYVEGKADMAKAGPLGEVCSQCALGAPGMLKACGEAVLGKAEATFGGDCVQRDVIYLRKEST